MFLKLLSAIGNKSNGKKTYIGVGLTLLGIALFWTPAAPVATKVVEGGLILIGVGVVHKAMKKEGERDV